MTIYLLTAAIHNQSERPLCMSTSLREVKDAAMVSSEGRWGSDWFCIYESEDGGPAKPLLEAFIRRHWQPDGNTIYSLDSWTPA